MKCVAAKEKSGSSGRSRSYLQTRVRGQRLYEAARILAFIELSRRLHQAYEQAYDKQAADRLLPQNPDDLKINHAFGDAATAISQKRGRKKDPCKDFFTKGSSLPEVTKVFANFWQSATHDPRWGGIAGTSNSGGGMSATLRLGTAFFLDEDDGTQGTGLTWSPVNDIYQTKLTNLTPRQNRALTILHEFAHALGLIPSDRDDPAKSAANDATIYRECGFILDTLPMRD